jgi:hypothetical protein
MLTDTEKRSGTFRGRGRRSRRRGWRAGAAAGLAAVAAAGLLAAAPAGAKAPPRDAVVFVHSAKSGELGGGRLTLHGVSGRVTWAHNSGRSGVMTVRRLHRMLFSPKPTTATGTLHVAGHHGGDELTFKLSRPRYNAARRTVSYKIKRLGNGRLPGRAAQAAGAARRFGPASLSMVGAPQGSVNVQQQSYGCANPPTTDTCWGILTASGLQPGAHLYVNVTFSGTGATEQYDWGDAVDQNGNISPEQPIYLQLPCTNDFNNTGTITSVEATAASGQSISLGTISPPAGYCD